MEQKFEFYVDKKVTVWIREKHYIKAQTFEEAKTQMVDAFHTDLCSETFEAQEHLYDTEDIMEPGDNGGQATIELCVDGEIEPITSNTDMCWNCSWVAMNNDSAYTDEEECRKCGLRRTI